MTVITNPAFCSGSGPTSSSSFEVVGDDLKPAANSTTPWISTSGRIIGASHDDKHLLSRCRATLD